MLSDHKITYLDIIIFDIMTTKGKIKVVFLGEQSTGKTSILTRFIDDKFETGLGVILSTKAGNCWD